METVTVTLVGGAEGQGDTEGTPRERKISQRVRKVGDVLTNVVTLNHNNHPHHHVTFAGADATTGQEETGGMPRERKISRMRRISDALTNIVTLNHQYQHYPATGYATGVTGQSEIDGATPERKISRIRKISDALCIVTLDRSHLPYPNYTLSGQKAVSLSDLVKSEQTPDTLSLRSKTSVDYTAAGIILGGGEKDHPEPLGDGHVLGGVGPILVGGEGKKWPQVVASIAANMGAFAFGAVLAWSSTGIASMQEEGDLGEVTSGISSWIGSIPTLGAVAACPFAGLALDTLGRRRSMLFLTVPFIIGWLLIGFAQNFFMVLLGRFVTGFCGGVFSVASPIFTAETADPSIRGGLGSLFDLLLSTGMLYIFVVGVFLPWRYQAFACAIIPVAFHIIMFFVPESPRYLIQKDKDHKAEKAIYWLKGSTINPEHVNKEISDLRASVGETKGESTSFSSLFDRSLVLPTSILLGIMFFTTLSAIDAVNAYTVNIFASAGSTMDPKLSTIVIGIVTVLGSMPTAALVDLAGRRILLMLSEVVMTFSLALMGFYFYLMRTEISLFGFITYDQVTWIPLLALVLFIIGYSLGCGPVSMMIIGELLPNRMKGLTSCIVLMTRWFLAFGVTNIFQTLRETLNDDGTYWLFACICFCGTFFVFFFVPETKGKSLAEIQLYFTGHKQSNIAIAQETKKNEGDSKYCYDNKIEVDI